MAWAPPKRGWRRVYRPAASVRAESTAPDESDPTRCTVTMMPLTGIGDVGPGVANRPETVAGRGGPSGAGCWARAGWSAHETPIRTSVARRRSLRIELAKVLGPQILEVPLQLFGTELRLALRCGALVEELLPAEVRCCRLLVRRLFIAGIEEQLLGRVDRGAEA